MECRWTRGERRVWAYAWLARGCTGCAEVGVKGIALGLGLVMPLAMLCGCSPDPPMKTLMYGPSEKVCQLTGERDWASGKAITRYKTTQFGMAATDLGYPVEHDGRLLLLFGDTTKIPQVDHGEAGPPDDAVGFITSRAQPTESECTDMLVRSMLGSNLVSPEVVAPFKIKHGIFNVPTGGVSAEGWLYTFFWTDHCNSASDCPETESLNMVGRGVLARSNDNGVLFRDAVAMPHGFVYSTAVDAKSVAGIPAAQRLGTYIFSVPRYRESVPYLAYAPTGTLSEPLAWQFFTGFKLDGKPAWVSGQDWERGQGQSWSPPGYPELFAATGDGRCVGEFSVTWNDALKVWLLLYNCKSGNGPQNIVARIASAPWGPWSEPQVILDANRDQSWCRILMRFDDPNCSQRQDYWPGKRLNGDFYAPYVMDRFTVRERNFSPGRRVATVYWLLSTWNPYQVIVMRTQLKVDTPLYVTATAALRR